MERLLITGAGGFIGRHVLETVCGRKEWDVHVTVSGAHPHSFPAGVQVHVADLLSGEDCEALLRAVEPDVLIHLAWELGGKGYQRSERNLVWTESSLRLLRLFFRNGGRRFIFAGTGAEYYMKGGLCQEYPSAERRTLYGESKRAFELLADNYCREHAYEFVSARIFSVYGEDDNRSNPSALLNAVRCFERGEGFTCMTPNNIWDFIHVDDVADALASVAGSAYCGTVNLGTGKPHLVRDAFLAIAREMNCGQLLRFEENTVPVIQVADTSVLSRDIGYVCKVELGDGLKRMVYWDTKRAAERM